MSQPRPLFHLFLSFQPHITKLKTMFLCEKMSLSIWCQDSNSQPLEHESPSITTGPGLPPCFFIFFEHIRANFLLKIKNAKIIPSRIQCTSRHSNSSRHAHDHWTKSQLPKSCLCSSILNGHWSGSINSAPLNRPKFIFKLIILIYWDTFIS